MIELKYFLIFIFLFVVNILFFLSGICLNSLVIISFWRSALLRKKLCYFMIMVLSCCDLLAVLTNHSLTAYIVMLRLTGEENAVEVNWVSYSDTLSTGVLGLSLLALLVMSFDRYLATYHPVYHRTSVTKGKLLTFLAISMVFLIVLVVMYFHLVLSFQVAVLIFLVVLTPLLLFMNYKLFTIARQSRGNRRITPETRKLFSVKDISSCLLAVACFFALFIPTFVHIGLRMNSEEKRYFDDAYVLAMCARTIGSMNGSFNCLIFYWKNAILRTEGMKVIKSIKICRR